MPKYREGEQTLFVRVPMSAEEKKQLDSAVSQTGMKKHEWIRRTLLTAARNELAKEAN